MLQTLKSSANRRTILKYIAYTVLVFSFVVTIQFTFVLKAFEPRFLLLPILMAIMIGIIIGWNVILRRDLEKSNQAKSELISGVSHELRTPLTVINGFSRILSSDENIESKHREYAQKIYDNGEHLLQVINDLLDLSQINSGKLNVHLQAVSIDTEFKSIQTLMSEMADKRNIKLEFPVLSPQLCVIADKTRFHQVLINLINNAIKYSPDDSTVLIKLIPREDRVQIFVIDKGPGIAQDKLDQLFIPFNRLGAEQTNVKGTGIGLAISKDLIDMMNGDIGVDSTPGQGSCFWIELPLSGSV